MIKSFRSKALAEFFSAGSSKKIQQAHAKKLKLILSVLNAASKPGDMATMPALGFHPLKGAMKGSYAVSVDGNTRVIFSWTDGHATNVDYDDYH